MPSSFKTSNKLSFLAMLILLFFFSACSNNKKKEIAAYKALDETLQRANNRLEKSNKLLYASFENKIEDPVTSVKAKLWQPKVLQIQELSKALIDYIKTLKDKIGNETGMTNEQLSELYKRLGKHKVELVKIDPQIKNVFDTTIVVTTREFDLRSRTKQEFAETFFKGLPPEGIKATLSMFQSNIKDVENRLLLFYNEKSTAHGWIHEWITAIVGQSSSFVRKGEKIEITAGVGAFSSRFSPEIVINGRLIPLNESGVAISKFAASSKPGKHLIPVELRYVDEDGKNQTISKTVEYTVAKE